MAPNLVYSIAILQPRFVRGEDPFLSLSLRNSGAGPVRIPLPGISPNVKFLIEVPGSQEALCADPVWGAHSSLSPPLPESEFSMAVLQPGQEWTGGVLLEDLLPMRKNGRYRISSMLIFEGVRVSSNLEEFKIEEARILQVSAAPLGAPEPAAVRIISLADEGIERSLWFDTWQLWGGEEEVPQSQALTEIRRLPAAAVDPVACATPHLESLFTFTFWREEGTVFGASGAYPLNRRLDLPGSVDRLLEPALLDRDCVAHLYALSTRGGSTKLLIARFANHLKDPKSPERLLAERPLAAAPAATAADIDVWEGRSRRSLVLARMEGATPRFDWMSYSGDAVPPMLGSHAWATGILGEAMPDSRPVIRGLAEGGIHVAWVIREAGPELQPLLLEAIFDAAGNLKSESSKVLAASGPIKAVRIVFREGTPVVFFWTETGSVESWIGEEFRTVVEKASDKVAPVLCMLGSTPHVIAFDPVRGMVLVAVR